MGGRRPPAPDIITWHQANSDYANIRMQTKELVTKKTLCERNTNKSPSSLNNIAAVRSLLQYYVVDNRMLLHNTRLQMTFNETPIWRIAVQHRNNNNHRCQKTALNSQNNMSRFMRILYSRQSKWDTATTNANYRSRKQTTFYCLWM